MKPGLFVRLLLCVLLGIIVYFIAVPPNEYNVKLADKVTPRHSLDKSQKSAGLFTFIGMAADEVERRLGTPKRIDPSAYQYEWWVYEDDVSYLLVGVEEKEVVTLFVSGRNFPTAPFHLGAKRDNIEALSKMNDTLSLTNEYGHFQFTLSEEDMSAKPIVSYNDHFLQLYFDTETDQLSSLRVMTGEIALRQRPYAMTYRGELPQEEEIAQEEQRQIDTANATQIFEMTNVLRKRYDKLPFKWNEETAKVAKKHSIDMKTDNYFSHESPTAGDLGDRLATGDVPYKLAGENIASQYIDGPAAVEGWLNSPGHREALLHDNFTRLGVGVYFRYYTQNFVQTWADASAAE
ncbi:CAP domain-containing protein [Aureibacillus halotolerans]|uniref:Uncharacterized protein YkwD n=1 Tax=Aureibacillus halotolerans TaxID=1508390 RepID=A0A4R6U953_9BACI|nr:CAP domain-containing protein [Aureibacillus halotolerans]TDQ42292.1 uncharacterized protein YkwD [Aureibacillus halotolerans]